MKRMLAATALTAALTALGTPRSMRRRTVRR